MGSQHRQQLQKIRLSQEETVSLIYHDIFDYPLTKTELAKWTIGSAVALRIARPFVYKEEEYYLLRQNEKLATTRVDRARISKAKSKLLFPAQKILSKQKNILMVAITGSLAMNNATEDSDIDFMIITANGAMWSTRLSAIFSMRRNKLSTRTSGMQEEKDKYCLNLWLEEGNMELEKTRRNIYTAHEIAQIIPLINKNNTYERFIYTNKWLKDYWPKAVEYKNLHSDSFKTPFYIKLIEPLSRRAQSLYMKRKITNERVGKDHAFFHPRDMSKWVVGELEKRGVFEK